MIIKSISFQHSTNMKVLKATHRRGLRLKKKIPNAPKVILDNMIGAHKRKGVDDGSITHVNGRVYLSLYNTQQQYEFISAFSQGGDSIAVIQTGIDHGLTTYCVNGLHGPQRKAQFKMWVESTFPKFEAQVVDHVVNFVYGFLFYHR